MMYVGFILWLLFAVAVLGFLGWSTNVLLSQKKAWAEFAAKYKLEVAKSLKILQPLSMTGVLNGRRLNIYAQTEQQDRERTQRIYSHIEVFLNAPPPVDVVISKRKLPEVYSDARLPATFTSASGDWPQPSVAETSDVYQLTNWLTPARMRALKNLMSSADADTDVLLMGNGSQALLLWRTDDPLRDARSLNALVQKLFGFAKELDGLADTGITAKPNPASATSAPSSSA